MRQNPPIPPFKCTQALADKVYEYLDTYTDLEQVVPTISGFAKFGEVTRKSCHQWINEDTCPAFTVAMAQLMAEQEIALVNQGLSGNFNPTISKLILTKHGYSDKQETDITSGGEKVKNEWVIMPTTNKDSSDD